MKKQYSQLQLPDPADRDPHPRLLLDGYGVHAGESFRALFPDGWHDITLVVHLHSRLRPYLSGGPVRGGINHSI